jgi:hypothetical protein
MTDTNHIQLGNTRWSINQLLGAMDVKNFREPALML